VTDPYLQFLTRAAVGLAPVGAVPLIAPGQPAADPLGLAGWDQILLADNPGQPTVYAFARATQPVVLQERLDALCRRLAALGFFQRPITLVAVAVLDGGDPPGLARRLGGIVPSAFYTGLRPVAWVVDLASGTTRKGGGRSFPGAEALEAAAHQSGAASEFDFGEAGRIRGRQVARAQAFYQLMQGRQPVVTYGLVAVNVLVYLVLVLNGGPENGDTLIRFGALVPNLVLGGQWWRLVTVMFLHASVAHILFNMISLVVVGTIAERLYGSPRFLAIYLGSGLIGGLASLVHGLLSNDLNTPAVGASGAIFGIVGALLTLRFQASEIIPVYVRSRIASSMVPIVVLNLLLGAVTQHVDNSAHLGGLIGGAALSFVFPLTRSLDMTPSGTEVRRE
jgi:membrane associated rhomboid family serine protease